MHIPGYSQLKKLYRELTPLEFVVFSLAGLLVVIGAFGLLGKLQAEVSADNPVRGGSLEEGIVGFPRYINPVLASSNADQDTAALVYAGLTKLDTDGGIELDLANDMEVSENGLTYTFTLRADAKFHDGHPVQAEDVVYTINMLQDQRIDSPLAADWSGISVRAADDQTVVFELTDPFRDFLYNTRLGILPKHLWIDETADSFAFSSLNINPIGAGPYEVAEIERNDEGLPISYKLEAFADFHNPPFTEEVNLYFYPTATERNEAFNRGKIKSVYGINPDYASQLTDKKIITKPLTRTFGVFFNQNNNELLVNDNVRRALGLAIDKSALVGEVLAGYGSTLSGPLPTTGTSPSTTSASSTVRLQEASELLSEAGWTTDDEGKLTKDGENLAITVHTASIPDLENTAEYITETWKELGVTVSVSSLSPADLSRDVIRPRNYEALLFGQSVNQGRDLYPFWHSSQLDDPGLNLAMYTNSNVDGLLEKYRLAKTEDEQRTFAAEAAAIIADEHPAIFLYTPDFIYAVPEKFQHIALPPITTPADRFAQIESWYSETTKVWNIFAGGDDGKTTAASSEVGTSTATTSPDR